MEIRATKKKRAGLVNAGVMDDELIDTMHNIRIKSNEFRDFGTRFLC